MRSDGRPSAVFLSGNGPLVKIVRAALVRDQQRNSMRATEAARTVATFIDNVHRFISMYGIETPSASPHENAIVFDEAQRAWDADAVAKAHQQHRSEPDLILDIMERAPNWCSVIALVGGGQEIHRGEAGLAEWGRALNRRQMPWTVLASPAVLHGGPSVAGHRLFDDSAASHLKVLANEALHLDVSVRCPRAKQMGTWINDLLSATPSALPDRAEATWEFPVVLTRSLAVARAWLRAKSDGDQRAGLLASSGALRLRADGIEVSSGFRNGFSYEDWFLSDRGDTRSSNWLEVAATEFECQGLELDWAGVCWGGDFLWSTASSRWMCRKFRGTKWQTIRKEAEIRYTVNKYRVLLTRARKGMVIWIPQGCEGDPTRDPHSLDATADLVRSLGVPEAL